MYIYIYIYIYIQLSRRSFISVRYTVFCFLLKWNALLWSGETKEIWCHQRKFNKIDRSTQMDGVYTVLCSFECLTVRPFSKTANFRLYNSSIARLKWQPVSKGKLQRIRQKQRPIDCLFVRFKGRPSWSYIYICLYLLMEAVDIFRSLSWDYWYLCQE